MRLKGKTALISGAGRNIGKAIALTFAREGADLILVAKELGDPLNQVANECQKMGVKTLPLLADVGKHEEVNRVARLGLERFGRVDVLVTVAAIRPHKLIWDYGYDEWSQVFAVNCHSTFYLAKALVPGMIERRSGSIVALGALSSLTAVIPQMAAVTASKHGLYGLIKSLALDLGPYGVRANLIAVGAMNTERRNPEWYPDAVRGDPNISSTEHTKAALRRRGAPQEVANAALFLASDESSYITGDRISCVGGRHM